MKTAGTPCVQKERGNSVIVTPGVVVTRGNRHARPSFPNISGSQALSKAKILLITSF